MGCNAPWGNCGARTPQTCRPPYARSDAGIREVGETRPGPNDAKLTILITGDELDELKRFTIDMVEAFGLDRRIEAYSGKRPIGFYRWDLDCLLAVMDNVRKDLRAYPDKTSSSYAALKRLHDRLQGGYRRTWE